MKFSKKYKLVPEAMDARRKADRLLMLAAGINHKIQRINAYQRAKDLEISIIKKDFKAAIKEVFGVKHIGIIGWSRILPHDKYTGCLIQITDSGWDEKDIWEIKGKIRWANVTYYVCQNVCQPGYVEPFEWVEIYNNFI